MVRIHFNLCTIGFHHAFLLLQFPCYELLTQGPCDEGQLFVLDEEIRFSNGRELPTAKCIDRECDPILQDGKNSTQETVMFNGKCTNVTSSAECEQDNMVVLVNPFGKGNYFNQNIYI